MNKVKANRKDVAGLAGVSEATVSYILNNKPGFSCTDETRERVKRAAEKLGYMPSFAAGSLVKGRTNILGLLLPSQERQFIHTYYSRIVHGLTLASDESDYYMMYLGQNRPEKYKQCFTRNLLDGMFVLQSTDDSTHIETVSRYEKPIVTINYLDPTGHPSVTMDYEGGMRQAVEHLVNRGRKRIGFVTHNRVNQPVTRYINAYDKSRERFAGKMTGEIVRLSLDYLEEGLPDIPEKNFDGLIVDEFWMYQKVEEVFRLTGKKRPQTVVFSDEAVTTQVPPDVMVLLTQPEKMGELAWGKMINTLDNNYLESESIAVSFTVY